MKERSNAWMGYVPHRLVMKKKPFWPMPPTRKRKKNRRIAGCENSGVIADSGFARALPSKQVGLAARDHTTARSARWNMCGPCERLTLRVSQRLCVEAEK